MGYALVAQLTSLASVGEVASRHLNARPGGGDIQRDSTHSEKKGRGIGKGLWEGLPEGGSENR